MSKCRVTCLECNRPQGLVFHQTYSKNIAPCGKATLVQGSSCPYCGAQRIQHANLCWEAKCAHCGKSESFAYALPPCVVCGVPGVFTLHKWNRDIKEYAPVYFCSNQCILLFKDAPLTTKLQ